MESQANGHQFETINQQSRLVHNNHHYSNILTKNICATVSYINMKIKVY